MITDNCQTGCIIAIERENNGINYAIVEIQNALACDGCKAKMTCLSKQNTNRIKALNTTGAKLGESVIVEFDDTYILTCSVFHYGFPLIGFLIGVFATYAFVKEPLLGLPKEIWQFCSGIVLLIACGATSTRIKSFATKERNFYAKITQINPAQMNFK